LNNVRYESTNVLENKLIFSVSINSVKYTATTDQYFNILNVWGPISIKEWIKESCTSHPSLSEASAFIKTAAQVKISNWYRKNKNFFDNFYSSNPMRHSKYFSNNIY
jgi:hypothetical protein